MSGLAQKRLIERIVEVFQEVKSQLDEMDESQIQKEYFMTEEFQTLLTLVLQEIQTTHDRAKLRMLASALTNSGQTRFHGETRKELFVRTLRALSPEHIRTLNSLTPTRITYEEFVKSQMSLKDFVDEDGYSLGALDPRTPQPWRAGPLKAFPLIQAPKGEQLLLLQNLVGNGLVEEMLGPRIPPYTSVLSRLRRGEYLTGLTPEPIGTATRCFKLSSFGEQFHAFVSRRTI
jgi:hypothetical protein